MTVVELDGGLWISSPVALEGDLQAELEDIGAVRWVLAPNRYHHLYVGDFAAAYPDAELSCSPGLKDKRQDIAWGRTVEDHATWGDVEALRIGGMPLLDELVFLHRPSRSLVVTDLLMNTERSGRWLTDLVLKLDGVRTGTPEVSRLFRAFAIRDRDRLSASIDHLLSWDFDRLVVCHGRNVERGAKDLVARALGRLQR